MCSVGDKWYIPVLVASNNISVVGFWAKRFYFLSQAVALINIHQTGLTNSTSCWFFLGH